MNSEQASTEIRLMSLGFPSLRHLDTGAMHGPDAPATTCPIIAGKTYEQWRTEAVILMSRDCRVGASDADDYVATRAADADTVHFAELSRGQTMWASWEAGETPWEYAQDVTREQAIARACRQNLAY